MKEYRIQDKEHLILTDRIMEESSQTIKVRMTQVAITYTDLLQYQAANSQTNIVPLHHGIGIVSDPQNSNMLSRGDRVFIDPYLACDNCYYCKSSMENFCPNMKILGNNSDGLLTEFKQLPEQSLTALPDSVTSEQALFIPHIARCVSIIDRLHLKKGDHLVVYGSDITANLLCQLALYYQAIPILVDNNEINVELAKKHGMYYIISNEQDAAKQITEITGGRLAENMVYFAGSKLSTKYIFSTCGYGSHVVLTGISQGNLSTNYAAALQKQLIVYYVANGYGEVPSAINLLVNKAVNVSNFIKNTFPFAQTQLAYDTYRADDINAQLMYNTVITL